MLTAKRHYLPQGNVSLSVKRRPSIISMLMPPCKRDIDYRGWDKKVKYKDIYIPPMVFTWQPEGNVYGMYLFDQEKGIAGFPGGNVNVGGGICWGGERPNPDPLKAWQAFWESSFNLDLVEVPRNIYSYEAFVKEAMTDMRLPKGPSTDRATMDLVRAALRLGTSIAINRWLEAFLPLVGDAGAEVCKRHDKKVMAKVKKLRAERKAYLEAHNYNALAMEHCVARDALQNWSSMQFSREYSQQTKEQRAAWVEELNRLRAAENAARKQRDACHLVERKYNRRINSQLMNLTSACFSDAVATWLNFFNQRYDMAWRTRAHNNPMSMSQFSSVGRRDNRQNVTPGRHRGVYRMLFFSRKGKHPLYKRFRFLAREYARSIATTSPPNQHDVYYERWCGKRRDEYMKEMWASSRFVEAAEWGPVGKIVSDENYEGGAHFVLRIKAEPDASGDWRTGTDEEIANKYSGLMELMIQAENLQPDLLIGPGNQSQGCPNCGASSRESTEYSQYSCAGRFVQALWDEGMRYYCWICGLPYKALVVINRPNTIAMHMIGWFIDKDNIVLAHSGRTYVGRNRGGAWVWGEASKELMEGKAA